MVPFVGRLARYMLQVAIEAAATAPPSGALTPEGAAAGATAMTRSMCRPSRMVAVEPECFRSPEGRRFLRQYFDAISDHADIFGSVRHTGTPLISQLDTILTSVGSFGQSWRTYTSELARAGGISADELAADFIGDLGGAVIPRARLNEKQLKTCQEIVDSWTGISLAQYGGIAHNAAKSGANGVDVIAIGANKLEVVLEVVRRGFVNQLIIDHDLANALLLRLR
jgi:hypothetical protein